MLYKKAPCVLREKCVQKTCLTYFLLRVFLKSITPTLTTLSEGFRNIVN